MKKIAGIAGVIAFLFAGILTLKAQGDYTVIKVYGNIMLKKDNKNLTQGDRFSDKDVLIFQSKESKAAVVHPEKGRLMLTEASGGGKANFVPAMSNVSTRGVNVTTASDLVNEFQGSYIFFNQVKLKVNSKSYPLSEQSFFFIRYKYKGEEINKKLAYSSDTVVIDKNELLKVDGKAVEASVIVEMKLYFMNNKKSTYICTFNPVFPDMASLQKEIEIISQTMNNKDKIFLLDEIEAYLLENYGKFDKTDLRCWLNTFL